MLLSHFVAALSHALRLRKITFSYPNSSKIIFQVLDILISEGLILGYNTFIPSISSQEKRIKKIGKLRLGVTIVFRLQRGRYNPLRSASVSSTPGLKFFSSWYQLKTLLFRHPSSVFLLSTDKGLLTGQIARKCHLGGKVLLRFN